MENNKKTLIFDFGGVILPESRIMFADELKVIFSISDEESKRIKERHRDKLRTGEINEKEFFDNISDDLGNLKYDKEKIDDMWYKFANVGEGYNKELIDFVEKLRNDSYICIILSDSYPPLRKIVGEKGWYDGFDDVIVSCDVGLSKKDDVRNGTTKVFDYVIKKHGLVTEDMIFIDDREENCSIAEKKGIQSILYKNNEQLVADLSYILSLDVYNDVKKK